ncbi:MAG: hypothetical protein PW843_27745 [Azospirillaceae bacterium]|nr:hypothetical protein [Azospirillaceae bacterium]
MHTDPGPMVLNDALSQLDRQLDAPAPERVPVDGRSLAQLLAFAAEYGTLINFYDLTNTRDGDWSAFFATDPTIALALLAGLDLPAIGADLQRLLRDLKAAEGLEARRHLLRLLLAAILRMVRLLDNGAQSDGGAGAGLVKAIRREIQGPLGQNLRRLATLTASSPPEQGLRLDLAGLTPHWGLARAAAEGGAGFGGRDRGWIDRIIALIGDVAATLLAALQRLCAQARDALDASMRQEGHAPQSALYITFATLFCQPQTVINGFARRLVDYYYYTILRQDSRAPLPDQVYLTFTPVDGVDQASVPKDTLFPAGTDAAGQDIAYAAERSLAVYPSAVAALRTLRVTQAPLIAGKEGDDAPAQVLTGTVTLADKPPQIATPFPPFGDDTAGNAGVLASAPASLGFALSSHTLMLTGGTRTITLRLTVTAASLAGIDGHLQTIGQALDCTDPATVLAWILGKGFILRYSAAGGWVTIPTYTVSLPVQPTPPATSADQTFLLSFTLPETADGLVALDTTPPADGATPPAEGSAIPTADRPVIMASLITDRVAVAGDNGTTVWVYPYAVLSELALSAMTTEVSVSGFANLTLTGPNGPMDPSQPFALLGSPPTQGGSLDITAPELFVKTLDKLSLSINWYDLPQTKTGFDGYYQGYVVDLDGNSPPQPLFTNTCFQVVLAVVEPGFWTLPLPPLTTVEPYYLFRTAKDDPTPVNQEKILPLTDFRDLQLLQQGPPDYYNPAASALRVTLSEPPYAFGDTLYARNVMAAALQEAPVAAACAEICALKCAQEGELAAVAPALDPALHANAETPDGKYRETVDAAWKTALQRLNGAVLKIVNDAVDKAAPALSDVETSRLRLSLQDALSAPLAEGGGLLSRLSSLVRASGPEPADITRNLADWVRNNRPKLAAAGGSSLDVAQAGLDAAAKVNATWAALGDVGPGSARPQMEAALLAAKAALTVLQGTCLQQCMADCTGGQPTKTYPNTPWLPTATSVALDYDARSYLPGRVPGGGDTFYHLLPLNQVRAVPWPLGGTVPLLAPQPVEGALMIGLTGAPPALTLLLQMTAGDAGWSSDPPPVTWSQDLDGAWAPLTAPDHLQGDGTNELQNAGIVTLKLWPQPGGADGLSWLRVSVTEGADRFPLLAGLATNALTAAWVGPGGAETLGTPLPAGTITASAPTLDTIATIDQPLPSFGGRPRAQGAAFQMWMAERLRHKDRAIQGWDYANLVLAEFPALWQAAVIPAGDTLGDPKPGEIRVVVVPGPQTPNITDTTVPRADPVQLAEVGAMLRDRASPFITLDVANPPYVRVTVRASVSFRDTDTVAAWTDRLNRDLIAWLSPWPPTGLGPRPADYYSELAIMEFIRHRPYVLAVLDLDLAYDPSPDSGPCYLTSAARHLLSGEASAARRPATPLALPAPATGAPS